MLKNFTYATCAFEATISPFHKHTQQLACSAMQPCVRRQFVNIPKLSLVHLLRACYFRRPFEAKAPHFFMHTTGLFKTLQLLSICPPPTSHPRTLLSFLGTRQLQHNFSTYIFVHNLKVILFIFYKFLFILLLLLLSGSGRWLQLLCLTSKNVLIHTYKLICQLFFFFLLMQSFRKSMAVLIFRAFHI